MTAVPMWFGPSERPLWAWLHVPDAGCAHAIVLCPPFGYEAWCSYQTYRALADRLVANGVGALRLDYDGTGSSAGHYTDPDRVAAWVGSVKLAIAELHRRGIARVSVIGLRFGAMLAALAATEGVDTLVLWDPVLAGKRYARELKAFAHAGGTSDPDAPDDGLLGVTGTIYTTDTVAEIAKLEAPVPAVRRVILLARDDRPLGAAYADRCTAAGIVVAQHAVAGMAALLETDNENAAIPDAALALIVAELGAGEPAPIDAHGRAEMALGPIIESVARVGPCALFGIHARAADDPRTHLVVMLGGGTEHQIGPGRVWVEFARALAARGIATLRADVDGVGDSPTRGPRSVVRSYDPEHILDIEDLVAFGRAQGYGKVVILGLCSGSWLAIHGAQRYPVDAIFALNAQLYFLEGMLVFSTLAASRAQQIPEREREDEGLRDGRWDYLDALGIHPPGIQWLEGALARGTRMHLAYAEHDEGIERMRSRNGKAFARLLENPLLTCEEMIGIDHGMHKFRKRAEVLAKIEAFVRAL